jgi:hypothetical protein
MMILTTRAVTTEYLVAELSLSVEVDDSDCGSCVGGGGDGGTSTQLVEFVHSSRILS